MILHLQSRQPFKRGFSALCLLALLFCASILLGYSANAQETSNEAGWIGSLNVQDADVSAYIAPLIDARSWPYTAPYLESYAALSPSEQRDISTFTPDAGVDLSASNTTLMQNLRVPPLLRADILAQIAEEDGIPADHIPALLDLAGLPKLSRAETKDLPRSELNYLRVARLLGRLEAKGDLSMREFGVIERLAPVGYEALPKVVGLRIVRAMRDEAEARADEAEARADETEARADETEARADETEARAAETTRLRLEAEARAELALQVLEAVERAANALGIDE